MGLGRREASSYYRSNLVNLLAGKGAMGDAKAGPQDFQYNLATKTRKEVRSWVRALGKTIGEEW